MRLLHFARNDDVFFSRSGEILLVLQGQIFSTFSSLGRHKVDRKREKETEFVDLNRTLLASAQKFKLNPKKLEEFRRIQRSFWYEKSEFAFKVQKFQVTYFNFFSEFVVSFEL